MLKEKHQGVFYRVSGKRKIFALDEKTGEPVDTGRILKERTRFESLKLSEAEAFATEVYKREDIMCQIHEVQR